MIKAMSHIAAMGSYALADMTPPPGKRLVSLCQNESLRPPSPAAIEAAMRAARDQHLYPDPDWKDLRAAIAGQHDIDAGALICGNGSLDLIGCLARAYLGPGDAALAPAHAYPFFRTATLAAGARFDIAPETDQSADIEALLAALRAETRVVFLANPGNPTGTRLAGGDIRQLRDQLPDRVLLVLDEAYGEFADHLQEPLFDLVARGNTVVLRSLSKAYGLAGARVGWGLFPPEVGAELRKLLNPNNVSAPSQAAAAAAMRDQAYMRETCALTADLREGVAHEIRALGHHVPESFTNFILIRLASAGAATRADSHLRAEGVFLRPQGGAGLPECLRLTVGSAADMGFAARLLKDWTMKEAAT